MKCSICDEEIDDEYGHNAEPVNNGRCCSFCNDRIVIPSRILFIYKNNQIKNKSNKVTHE